MKSGYIQILDLDFEYKLWKNRLHFYFSEIEIIEGRIHVLSKEIKGFSLKSDKTELLSFQKQAVKSLLNQIEILEQEMALYAEDYPIDEKHVHSITHNKLKTEMNALTVSQNALMCSIFPELCK